MGVVSAGTPNGRTSGSTITFCDIGRSQEEEERGGSRGDVEGRERCLWKPTVEQVAIVRYTKRITIKEHAS